MKGQFTCGVPGCTSSHSTLLHSSKNPKLMSLRVNNVRRHNFKHLYNNAEQGILKTMQYVFKKSNIGTVVLFDLGASTSLITASLTGSLFLKGKLRCVSLYHVGETQPQVALKKHYTLRI